MTFTALHRALGEQPGPITAELIEAAVAAHVAETDNLDWKSREMPPAKNLPQTDFPKDVAAMANSGGGIIVYGVAEVEKAATEVVGVAKLDESHERAFKSAAVTGISPPVFGLNIQQFTSSEGKFVVVVEVPASVDGPHLVYRGEYFGAPVRNGADTVWMRERQVEAMYRARFEERRHAAEELDSLFAEASAGRETNTRAWLVAVAHPRIPRVHHRLSRRDAQTVFGKAAELTLRYANRGSLHPLEIVNRDNPRPGLRRWVAPPTGKEWKEAWASIHHNGAVTVAVAVGGRPESATAFLKGSEVDSSGVESAVADFMALTRLTAETTSNDEYEVRVGINWTGDQPMTMMARDDYGFGYNSGASSVPQNIPVETTVNAAASAPSFHRQVFDLVMDCVNQGGIREPRLIKPLPNDENKT